MSGQSSTCLHFCLKLCCSTARLLLLQLDCYTTCLCPCDTHHTFSHSGLLLGTEAPNNASGHRLSFLLAIHSKFDLLCEMLCHISSKQAAKQLQVHLRSRPLFLCIHVYAIIRTSRGLYNHKGSSLSLQWPSWTFKPVQHALQSEHAFWMLAGYLHGFDKFMNLILMNVTEDYTLMVRVPHSYTVTVHEPAGPPPACATDPVTGQSAYSFAATKQLLFIDSVAEDQNLLYQHCISLAEPASECLMATLQ